MFKAIFKTLVTVVIGFTPTFPTDTIDDLERLGIPHTVVEVIEQNPHADGYYDGAGMIWLSLANAGNSRYRSDNLAAHEIIHFIRDKYDMVTGSRRIEEAIAVYGTEPAVKILFGYEVRINEKRLLKKVLKVNGLDDAPLTSSERDLVDKEVNRTILLLFDFLGLTPAE